MSKSTHQIAVKGVDQTGAAFKSVQKRASDTSAQMRKMLGGALAAAGAYLSFRSVVSAITELGHLSDVAMKAGANVQELTQAATALRVLGIQGASVEQMAQAFAMMEKNTGRSGLAGFKSVLAELGKIPDQSERAKAAMQVFGRSGLNFMPLINAAHEGTDALDGVIKAMPGVSDAAANAGDAAADAMTIAGNGIKAMWLRAIGAVCGWFDDMFVGGIRTAAANAMAALEYYAKLSVVSIQKAWKSFTSYFSAIGSAWGAAIGTWTSGGSFSEGFDAMARDFSVSLKERDAELEELDKKNQERVNRWEQERIEKMREIESLAKNIDAAAGSRKPIDADALTSSGGRARQIRNDLILGGSAAEARLVALGPQMSEEKKQTGILEKIAVNTKKTADSIGDVEDGVDLQALDL